MQKRKALDSGCQSEQKKHMTEKEKSIEVVVDAMKIDTISGMETDMKIESCGVTSNIKIEDTEDKGAQPEKNPDLADIIVSCSTEVKSSHENEENKSIDTSLDEDAPNSLFKDVQVNFSSDVLALNGNSDISVLSGFAEKGSLKKITEENFMPSGEKENSALIEEGACGDSELGSNSVIVESISNRDNETENKEENELLGSQCKVDGCNLSAMTKITGDISNAEVAKEKEPDKGLNFSSCEIKQVPVDAPDAILQEEGNNTDGNSIKEVSEASEISADGILKGHPSPIRGVIDESASLNESIEKDLLNSSKKEEACFSFQITEKFPIDESSANNSENACSGIERNVILPTVGENNDLNIERNESSANNSENTCIVNGIANDLENEVVSLPGSHTSENGLTSDIVNFQDKGSEGVILEPEKNLPSLRKKILLVLDLNGILTDIVLDIRNVRIARKKVGGKAVYKRPYCDDFLKFCFEKFEIGIWSSRRKYNVDGVLDFIMGDSRHKLLFCWDQSHCTNTGLKTLENMHKPLVLKELKKLWNKEESDLPWEMGDYSPSNTLLVDDSPYKALRNPPHTAIFPHPYRFDDETDTSLGPGGDLRVYLEGLSEANDVQLYVQQHPFGQQAITNSDSSWDFYLQVLEKNEQSLAPTE